MWGILPVGDVANGDGLRVLGSLDAGGKLLVDGGVDGVVDQVDIEAGRVGAGLVVS